jgi:hypothetical protein
MSDKVLDTKVDLIKKQAYYLIEELLTTQPSSPNQGKSYLENKYNYLFKISPGLFNLIITEALSTNFNLKKFQSKLDIMLCYIKDIQESKITQHTASEKVGIVIADEYIPKDLYKKEDLERLYKK